MVSNIVLKRIMSEEQPFVAPETFRPVSISLDDFSNEFKVREGTVFFDRLAVNFEKDVIFSDVFAIFDQLPVPYGLIVSGSEDICIRHELELEREPHLLGWGPVAELIEACQV